MKHNLLSEYKLVSGVIAAPTVLADAPLEDGLAGSCRHGHYHLFALREKEIVQI